MKLRFIIVLALFFGYLIFSSNTKMVNAQEVKGISTIPAPVYVFQIGYASSSGAVYLPRKDEICKLRHGMNASYLGTFSPFYSMLIIKFTSDSAIPLAANLVECEKATSVTAEERLSWYLTQPENSGLNLSNSQAMYVDGQSLSQVTLTPTFTNSPTPTKTPTVTNTVTWTSTNTATPSETVSETPTETLTETSSETSTPNEAFTSTRTASRTKTVTMTRTITRTSTRSRTSTITGTVTRSRTNTRAYSPTNTPTLGPDFTVGKYNWKMVLPAPGLLCYGEKIGDMFNVVVYYTDYSPIGVGTYVRGGGCFSTNNYSYTEIYDYLKARGINYEFRILPTPLNTPVNTRVPTQTRTPSITLVPTRTVLSNFPITYFGGGTWYPIPALGTICWGEKIGPFSEKVVRFSQDFTTGIRITNGGCHYGYGYTAEDVYYYLIRRTNFRVTGYLDYP